MSVDDQSFNRFMRTVGANRLLTGVEEKELARRIAKGDRSASDKLAEHNVRLVIHIAKSYARWGYDMEDLVQEGSVGLMKAVERFDPDRGFKFSTYATWWIRQAIHRYIAGAGGATIRVPGRVQKIRRDVSRKMSNDNISMEDACKALEIDFEEASEAMIGPRVTVSLDQTAFDDEGESRHNMIEDVHAVDPQQIVTDSHVGDWSVDDIRKAMASLPERRRRVVELRFGFDGPAASRNDTAKELELSVKIVQKEQGRALQEIARILVRERMEGEGLEPDEAEVKAVYETLRYGIESDGDEPVCVRP